MPGKPRIPDTKVIEAIYATGGLISAVARKLGYASRASLTERIAKTPALREALEDSRAVNLDLAESKLLQAINKGELTAIIFYLKCQGKKRGYVERQEYTGADGGPIKAETATIPMTAEQAKEAAASGIAKLLRRD